MALVRSWSASVNQTPSSQTTQLEQARSVIRAWKDAIVSAGWTVQGSSGTVSGTAAAAFDATDRWTANANLLWNPNAASSATHGWIVLKSPSGYPSTGKNIYLLLALSAGTGSQNATTRTSLVRIVWSSSAFSGGDTKNDPAATSGTTRDIASQQFIRGDGTTSFAAGKWHAATNTTGDFVCWFSNNGVGYACSYLMSSKTSGAESGDNYPWVGSSGFGDAAPGGLTRSALEAGNSAGVWIDGTAVSSNYVVASLCYGGTPVGGLFAAAGSSISAAYPALPLVVISPDSTKIAARGTMVDIAGAPSGAGVAQGTVQPASGTALQAIVGECWVPCGGTAPSF
jgi:hypothetical protein